MFDLFPSLSAILDKAGGEVLQALRCCRRCGVAGGERVPPAPLGRYFCTITVTTPSVEVNQAIISLIFETQTSRLEAPGALAHRLQRRTACKTQNGHQGAKKLQMRSGKGFNPRLLDISSHFC